MISLQKATRKQIELAGRPGNMVPVATLGITNRTVRSEGHFLWLLQELVPLLFYQLLVLEVLIQHGVAQGIVLEEVRLVRGGVVAKLTGVGRGADGLDIGFELVHEVAGHVVAVGLGAELVVAHRAAGANAHLLRSETNGRVL